MKENLPNFLIVGAAKSGTSSLHNYLNQHPEIFMPSYKDGVNVKEPQFLIKNKVKDRLHFGIWGWQEYKALFDDATKFKAIGESSVFYLYYYKEAIKNIKFRLGDNVKIIILLRNPIDRAYSAFQHVSRGLKENLSFEEALQIEENRLNKEPFLTPMVMYKDMGLYYNMVKAYSESFKNVHIILYEDFVNRTDNVLKEVFKFLDVDTRILVDSSKKYNVGGKRWKSNWLKNIFQKDNFIKKLVPKNIRSRVREKLVNLSTNKVAPMNKHTKESLKIFFKEDISNLSKLLGEDLNSWIR
tara:strand:+ start:1420 stop:2313 length:894 start_codon:yes stop_codon:yes gene_type:complete